MERERRGVPVAPETILESVDLAFFDDDGVGLADLDAGFATEAFFLVHGNGFAVLKFENFDGTDINTFAVAGTFVVVDNYAVTHFSLQR